MPTKLSTLQEAFCRHYAVSGNAAASARKAGYAEDYARQQGYENLHKPHIVIRLDEIRQGFAETAARESAILLSRLERIWRSADADDNLFAMLQAVGMEAKLSGLTGDREARLRLWGADGQAGPLERAVERAGDRDALAAAEAAAPRDPAQAARREASAAAVFEPEPEPEPDLEPEAPDGDDVDFAGPPPGRAGDETGWRDDEDPIEPDEEAKEAERIFILAGQNIAAATRLFERCGGDAAEAERIVAAGKAVPGGWDIGVSGSGGPDTGGSDSGRPYGTLHRDAPPTGGNRRARKEDDSARPRPGAGLPATRARAAADGRPDITLQSGGRTGATAVGTGHG
ncbi:MAG: terminase small subunit [Bauldia litoralis]